MGRNEKNEAQKKNLCALFLCFGILKEKAR